MLPILKDNIEKTELNYFVKHFLPLAQKLRSKSEVFAANKQIIEAKVLFTLYTQVSHKKQESNKQICS
jgi:hypothetical protein